MILFVTALLIEARPLIEHYHLKKDLSSHAFAVYKNDATALIISGSGKVRAAMAVIYFAERYAIDPINLLVNVGCCATQSDAFAIGDIALIDQVRDNDTGREAYPDILVFNKLLRATLLCHSQPYQKEKSRPAEGVDLVDMESAGIMEAARLFLGPHRVLLLKIVSDDGSQKKLCKTTLREHFDLHINVIVDLIDQVLVVLHDAPACIFDDFLDRARRLCCHLKFSVAMTQRIEQAVTHAAFENKDLTSVFAPYWQLTPTTKTKGKEHFERLLADLSVD